MCPAVFLAWSWENSPGWFEVQKWFLPSRGESWTSPFQFLMSIIMSWLSQGGTIAPSGHAPKKAISPTWSSREHSGWQWWWWWSDLFLYILLHLLFSWSFLLHQAVVTPSLQQPYPTAGGIYLCLNLCIFSWWYFSDYKSNEIKQNSIKAAWLEAH